MTTAAKTTWAPAGRSSRAVTLAAALLGLLAALPAQALPAAVSRGLAHENYKVRLQAAAAVASQGGAGARQALEGLLDDREPLVRVAACDALLALGDPAALPALKTLLADDHDMVRRRARLARRVLKNATPSGQRQQPREQKPVILGSVVDNSSSGNRGLAAKLQRALEDELRNQDTALKALRRRYELIAQVRSVDEQPARSETRVDVQCHLTVAELPGRTLRLSTQVTAAAAVSGYASPQELVELAQDAAVAAGSALVREFTSWAVVQPAPSR